jgi:hypothetical protein
MTVISVSQVRHNLLDIITQTSKGKSFEVKQHGKTVFFIKGNKIAKKQEPVNCLEDIIEYDYTETTPTKFKKVTPFRAGYQLSKRFEKN